MIIAVGSTNKAKVLAVKEVLLDSVYFSKVKVIEFSVSSDVSDQPISLQETIQGAKNRAKNAFEKCDCKYSFGIESGLMEASGTASGYLHVSACCIYDGINYHTGLSTGFEIPPQILELILNKKMDLSQACLHSGISSNTKIGSTEGLIGVLTKGKIDRKEYSKQCVIAAVLQLENYEWYAPNKASLAEVPKSIKAVIFDCDGTLVDSEYAHYLSWKHALSTLGSDLTLDEYYQYVGKSAQTNAQLLAEKTGRDAPDLILKMKREYYEKLCKAGLPPISSTVDFLKCLAAKKESLGIKIGVCSAARKVEILAHLRHLEIEHLLDIVLSGQEDLGEYFDPEGVNKPKPYIYLHAMKKLGASPDNTVVIEDSASGAAASVAAGCFTIAVQNDYTQQHDLSHAHMRIKSFAGLSVDDFFKMIASS